MLKQVKVLAGVDPNTYDIYLDVRGGHDRIIANDELVRLDEPGVERFVTLIRHTTEGSALLPERDRRYLDNSGYRYEVVQENGSIGIVLKDFPLPEGKFVQATADTLIILPGGYPSGAAPIEAGPPRQHRSGCPGHLVLGARAVLSQWPAGPPHAPFRPIVVRHRRRTCR